MCRAAVSQFASDINDLFQNSNRGALQNQNDSGVTYTSILINNAIDSFNDPALISNAQNRLSGQNIGSYQRVGYDGLPDRVTIANPPSDRGRELFGFNYFRLGTQSTSPFPSPSNQRRIMIINGSTREILFSFTPTGSSSSVRAQVSAMRDTMIAAVNSVSNVTVDPFAQWASAQNIPAAAQSESADPDGDGINNLLEYAFGTNPITADSNQAPRIENSPTGLIYRFQRSTTADVSPFTIQSSTDLAVWNTFTPAEENISTSTVGEIEQISIILTESPAKFFLNLTATRTGTQ